MIGFNHMGRMGSTVGTRCSNIDIYHFEHGRTFNSHITIPSSKTMIDCGIGSVLKTKKVLLNIIQN